MLVNMAQQIDFGIANRIANENQLLNEEKWIIEALKKIKKQRHSLEIERLHLISLQSQHFNTKGNTNEVSATCEESNTKTQSVLATTCNMDVPYLRDDECNEEELNLTVSNHFIQSDRDMDMEEYEDEDADDDDYDIDMNMFMNGEHNDKS